MNLEKGLRKVDITLIVVTLLLVTYGALVIHGVTSAKGTTSLLSRQLIWIVLGLFAMIVFAFLNYNFFQHYTFYIYILNLVLLFAVIFIGHTAFGAQRWIPLFGFRFQPSEFAKVALILTLSSFLATRRGDISSFKDLFLAILHVGIPVVLIAGQPDLGTSLVLVAILMGLLLAGGTKIRYYIVLILVGIILGFSLVYFHVLDEYQIKRLIVFFNPNVDPLGAGYNLAQSKIAVGSGGLLGKGLFSGTQTNLQFVPRVETDFIFAAIGEKLGFLGALFLLLLYFILIFRGIRIASLSKNLFGALVAIGIVSMWIFQILVNVGMTIGIMPITGIPLPFVSYGGSSMVANLMSVGLLLSIYSRRFE